MFCLIDPKTERQSTSGTVYDPELKDLATDIPKIILQDRAPQTVKTYSRAFEQWKTWAKSKGLRPLPASGHEFALYLAFLLRSAMSMSTMNPAVYGTAWAHKKVFLASPTEHPLKKQMIEASKRIIGTALVR